MTGDVVLLWGGGCNGKLKKIILTEQTTIDCDISKGFL